MSQRERDDLLSTTNFRVAIGGREVGFSEIEGLASGIEPRTVVLRRALTRSSELYDWKRSDDRRDVTIEQLDAAGGEVVNSWTLVDAHPVRWSGPRFDAVAGGPAFEELELAYEDLRWTKGA